MDSLQLIKAAGEVPITLKNTRKDAHTIIFKFQEIKPEDFRFIYLFVGDEVYVEEDVR